MYNFLLLVKSLMFVTCIADISKKSLIFQHQCFIKKKYLKKRFLVKHHVSEMSQGQKRHGEKTKTFLFMSWIAQNNEVLLFHIFLLSSFSPPKTK